MIFPLLLNNGAEEFLAVAQNRLSGKLPEWLGPGRRRRFLSAMLKVTDFYRMGRLLEKPFREFFLSQSVGDVEPLCFEKPSARGDLGGLKTIYLNGNNFKGAFVC